MLRKLLVAVALGALGYAVYRGLNGSDFWGTRGHDRTERMQQIQDAVDR